MSFDRSGGAIASSPPASSPLSSGSGSPLQPTLPFSLTASQQKATSPSMSSRRVLQERQRSTGSSNSAPFDPHAQHSRQSHRHHSRPGNTQSAASSSSVASSISSTGSPSPITILPSAHDLKPSRSASSPYTITSPFPIRLPEYSEATKVFESKHTVVYHATRVSDGVDVVLKLPNSRQPGRARLLVFGQQFDLLKSIEAQGQRIASEPSSGASVSSGHSSPTLSVSTGNSNNNNAGSASVHHHSGQQHSSLSEGVIRAYDLISIQSTLILVCEYFNGPSLHSYLSTSAFSSGFPLIEFLCLGIKLSHVLYDVHQQNIIHKDITASNILYNRQTRQIKIIDFGLATVAPMGASQQKKITQLVGTLAYISPEQTGRVSRGVDYRTDLC